MTSQQQADQEKINADFEQELKTVYAQIDKSSNLYWSHKNESQLLNDRRAKNTRSRQTEESKQEEGKWEKETDAQFGYGEITKGALKNLLTTLQVATETILVEEEVRKDLPYPDEEYNLTHQSTFLDIGSGFGKPVFHASMQTFCRSKGIEVVPARVFFSMDQKYEISEDTARQRRIKEYNNRMSGTITSSKETKEMSPVRKQSTPEAVSRSPIKQISAKLGS